MVVNLGIMYDRPKDPGIVRKIAGIRGILDGILHVDQKNQM
jgi:hypothetical protein